MTDLRSTIETHFTSLASELAAVIREQLVEELRAQVTNEVRAEVFSSIRGMSLADIMAMSSRGEAGNGGTAKAGPGRPKKKSAAVAASPRAAAPQAAKAPKAKKTAKGRLARRSEADIKATLESIVSLLKKHPSGLRSEVIGKSLSLDKRELPRPLADGLAGKLLEKSGEKRATTYFLRSGKKKG